MRVLEGKMALHDHSCPSKPPAQGITQPTSHVDRTPKQKLKIKITAEPLLALFHKYKDGKGKQAKLKSPLQLQELLDITGVLLAVRMSLRGWSTVVGAVQMVCITYVAIHRVKRLRILLALHPVLQGCRAEEYTHRCTYERGRAVCSTI